MHFFCRTWSCGLLDMAKDTKEEGGDAGRRWEESELFKEQPLALPSARLLKYWEGYLSDSKGAVLAPDRMPFSWKGDGKEKQRWEDAEPEGQAEGHELALEGSLQMFGAFVRGGCWWRVCCVLSRAWGLMVEKVACKRAVQENRAGSGRSEQITAVMMLTTFSE